MLSVDGLNLPWLPNSWCRRNCLNRDTAPVKTKVPEQSQPDAVSYHLTYAEDTEIEQEYCALGKKEGRPYNQDTGIAILHHLSYHP